MNKAIITIISLLIGMGTNAQKRLGHNVLIKGTIINKTSTDDSIFFIGGQIAAKYYEGKLVSSKLTQNSFVIENGFSYPMMYRVLFLTDKNKRAWRNGDYFIDPSTRAIKIDYSAEECVQVDGGAAHEYQTDFIPFMTKGLNYDCKSNYLSVLFHDRGRTTDSLLYEYAIQHPNSYVALWKLAERFSAYGQSALRQKTLQKFSGTIKTGRLWQILNRDFSDAKIKDNEKFPNIALKTIDLKTTQFTLPTAKYTLVDYWFCRCRPCLDTIPVLKKLYSDYKDKGFEIVSISVDETINVPLWQKRVKSYDLNWPQYLEENDFRNNSMGIKSFPCYILLDKEGKIIWRDFDLHDLDAFLKQHT